MTRRLTVAEPSERYVDARELAALMGISTSTVKRWVAQGLPSETWGMSRTRRFLPSRAIAWAQNQRKVSESRDRDSNAPGQRQPKE
jgi:predicted DNA-binding transcriptional regulator AlpA